ncbi:MAG: fructosamine kinase family protein [Pseudomonadales bacterium]
MPLAKPTLSQLNTLFNQQQLGTLDSHQPVSGGCICQSFLLTTVTGPTKTKQAFFLKTHRQPPANFFYREAAGLEALTHSTRLRIPKVIAAANDYLLLEYIEEGYPSAQYWQTLAQGMAELHRQTQPYFGFTVDNFCGETPQPNPATSNGYQFFADQRLHFQTERAISNGLLTKEDQQAIDRLINKLPSLIPEQAPSLIHGDLWSGNIYCDAIGQPVLIDPSCHFGWREADIAMTRLFGHLPDTFYSTYQELLPMEEGWQQRMSIYNLYHLLNHLNLFGNRYLNQVRQVIRTFV